MFDIIVFTQDSLATYVRWGIKTYFVAVMVLCTVGDAYFAIRIKKDSHPIPSARSGLYPVPIFFAQRPLQSSDFRKKHGIYIGERIGWQRASNQHGKSHNSTAAKDAGTACADGLHSNISTRSRNFLAGWSF